LSEIAAMNITVIDSNVVFENGEWKVANITKNSGWTADAGEFEITLKNRDDNRPAKYHLYFESKNPVSLMGFDSLSLSYTFDIYNLDDYYDNEVILTIGVKTIEFKVGDGNYQTLYSINQLLTVDLPVKFRLYMIVNSGVNGGPYNEASYTIRYGIYGFYK
ncbi:MAG: hypothetical protein KDD94_07020, partial [Calditrichaeota bacterium]|nr:hypothetical protein [Calditrichota bacterium]